MCVIFRVPIAVMLFLVAASNLGLFTFEAFYLLKILFLISDWQVNLFIVLGCLRLFLVVIHCCVSAVGCYDTVFAVSAVNSCNSKAVFAFAVYYNEKHSLASPFIRGLFRLELRSSGLLRMVIWKWQSFWLMRRLTLMHRLWVECEMHYLSLYACKSPP